MLILDRSLPRESWAYQVRGRNGVSMPLACRSADKLPANAGPWASAIQEIASYEQLGDNWDGYGAEAPSPEIVESAIGLAYSYSQKGVEPPQRVSPGVAGSVIFEWQHPDGTYATVEVDAPLHAEVMVIEPGKDAQQWTLPTD